MKKTYSKMTTDLLLIENEGSFMQCSVRVKHQVFIEDYQIYDGFSGANATTDGKDWNVTFDD